MLNSSHCIRGGKIDKEALVGFIKDIKKNTKLSDEDAAVIAASKVSKVQMIDLRLLRLIFFKVVASQPKSRMWYRIGATRNMTGGRKITPTLKMADKLKEVIVLLSSNRF